MNNFDFDSVNADRSIFDEDDTMDIKSYVSLFVSNWHWFVIALFVAATVAYGFNRYSVKLFRASSSILIKDESLGGYSEMSPIFPGREMLRSNQNLRNEIGILKSFHLNRQVVDSLPEFGIEYTMIGRRGIAEQQVYKNTPFTAAHVSGRMPGGVFEIAVNGSENYTVSYNDNTFAGVYGDTLPSAVFDVDEQDAFEILILRRNSYVPGINEPASRKYSFRFVAPDAVANEYLGKLAVNPIDEEASLVILSVVGHAPMQEIDYLNKLMDLYIKRGLNEKNKTSEQTVVFIDGQLDIITDSLRKAEDILQAFRRSNRLIDISNEGSSIKARLEKFETDKFALLLKKQYLDHVSVYLDAKNQMGDIVAPSVMGINDPVLERLITELRTLQLQHSQLNLNLIANQPAVGMLDDRIAAGKESLKENIKSNLQGIELSVAELNTKLGETEAALERFPDTEKQYIRIQRTFDLNNTIYNYLLEKRAEAKITEASNISDNKVVDYAGVQNVVQIKPTQLRNYLLAAILGFMIPAIIILVLNALNNKIIDKKDVERITKAPILGFISHNEYKTDIPVAVKPSSTLAESFRAVRTALDFFLTDTGNPVISITSTVSSEGKSFISVNLALIIANLGKKVLLVGLDLRKPKIHKALDTDNAAGMSLYLSGKAEFDESITETGINNLWLATSGPIPPNPAELIASDRMLEFINEARKRFDYVVIDTPPIAVVTDALLVSRYADINLFIVRQRYTTKDTLHLIQEFYQTKKFKNLSIIINDISLSGYYGYGLRYGYTMKYRGYSYGYSLYGDYTSTKYGFNKGNKSYYNNDEE
ncbi:MAG: polysaccharide biosynthesis tyrosine autokinase [Bacteroidales bacterium]|jgi:capsular exopolysaccharide synthesis family protein|nr:polysaccharide biosynthesis tyrosine autokinase [Bacteroidales bacterium]